MDRYENFKKIADILRALCLISTTESLSGHPTSCLSFSDIAAVLFDKYFRYDLKNPKDHSNDRFILSKGHAAPLLYSIFALAGALPRKELLSLRKFGSVLEGHPTPRWKYVDVATGSLGQGFSVATGIAYIAKKEGYLNKIFTILGDSECAEGQIYEALHFASFYNLSNLIVIVDVNSLGQMGSTMYGHDLKKYQMQFLSFGFKTEIIDGHSFSEIDKALSNAVSNNNKKVKNLIHGQK